MRVLILGGNGFIGFELCRALAGRGHAVTALARDPGTSARRMPGIAWLRRDLATMQSTADWQLLRDFDAVVNAAGALQDSARDDVAAVQRGAMLALYQAAKAAGIRLVVQISARTEGLGAERAFLSSKRDADTALAASGVPFVILRPAIVIGRNAHGGSALLRALAAIPLRTPLVGGGVPMQFTAMADVTMAVGDALEGRIAAGSDVALAGSEVLTLAEAIALHRAWLGLSPARTMEIPAWLAAPFAFGADLLGRLGWRSPLRSTAMEIAGGGVIAARTSRDPARPCASLAETLSAKPAGVQDLWFARLYLLKPVIIGMLALFWLASGVIALVRFDQSAAMLATAGLPGLAKSLTAITSIADILLGAGVLVRRFARPALIGMIVLSLGYLAGGTVLSPWLWADPLGPLLKVLPSIALALAALAILDER